MNGRSPVKRNYQQIPANTQITQTEKSGETSAKRIFGSIKGRLPLSESELKILEELVRKITE